MKHTLLNQKARKKIAELAEQNNLSRCELKLAGCMGDAHAPAHRHKRSWYYDKPEHYLYDLNQWVAACTNCHLKIEFDRELTMSLFNQLRGKE